MFFRLTFGFHVRRKSNLPTYNSALRTLQFDKYACERKRWQSVRLQLVASFARMGICQIATFAKFQYSSWYGFNDYGWKRWGYGSQMSSTQMTWCVRDHHERKIYIVRWNSNIAPPVTPAWRGFSTTVSISEYSLSIFLPSRCRMGHVKVFVCVFVCVRLLQIAKYFTFM